ncbi:hypothetical protein Tco_0991781 [Tanacetum coccineum]|uniref:Uncharacterized protein n=1 Tax=Tanacetum coccineum TaxID=301880 RepID=A0ABQ5F1Y2_9ASTR
MFLLKRSEVIFDDDDDDDDDDDVVVVLRVIGGDSAGDVAETLRRRFVRTNIARTGYGGMGLRQECGFTYKKQWRKPTSISVMKVADNKRSLDSAALLMPYELWQLQMIKIG